MPLSSVKYSSLQGRLQKHINNYYWEKPPEHLNWSREMQEEKNGAKDSSLADLGSRARTSFLPLTLLTGAAKFQDCVHY